MAITFTWGIGELNVLQTPQTDFVSEIEWFCKAVDGSYSGKRSGMIKDLKAGDSFTAFADLTESQVIGWVKDILGTDAVAVAEQATTNMINSQKNPPTLPASKEKPWGDNNG
jgi:hypothetical protein